VVPGYFGLIGNKKQEIEFYWKGDKLSNETEVTITTNGINKVPKKTYICTGGVSNTGKKKFRPDSLYTTDYKNDQGDTKFRLKVKGTDTPLRLTNVKITGCRNGANSKYLFDWLYNTVPK
jgi:hypothetical protein